MSVWIVPLPTPPSPSRSEWALRANIVIDKQGIIQFVEEGDSAVDPNTALTMCTTLHKKDAAK